MSPTQGRPPIDNPKNKSYKIRLTTEEKEKLEYCAKQTGMTKAEVLLKGIDLVYRSVVKK